MGMSWQEEDVRKVYAGIAQQAITDISNPLNLGTWREVRRFLRSDWGQHVCDTIGLSPDRIEKEFNLEEKIKQAKEIELAFEEDKTDDEIAESLEIPVKFIKRFRKRFRKSA